MYMYATTLGPLPVVCRDPCVAREWALYLGRASYLHLISILIVWFPICCTKLHYASAYATGSYVVCGSRVSTTLKLCTLNVSDYLIDYSFCCIAPSSVILVTILLVNMSTCP